MSRWDDRLENHQSVGSLRQLESLHERTGAPDDSAGAEDWTRIPLVAGALLRLIDETDAALMSEATLERLVSPLQSALSATQSYESSPDVSYLQNANAYLDQALDVVGVSGLRLGTKPAAIRQAAKVLRKSAEEVTDGLRERVQASDSALDDLRLQVQETQRANTEQLADVEQRVAEVLATVETQKSRVDTAIAQFQGQFSQAEARRAEAATQAARDQSASVAELRERLSEDAKAALEQDAEPVGNGVVVELVAGLGEPPKKVGLRWAVPGHVTAAP